MTGAGGRPPDAVAVEAPLGRLLGIAGKLADAAHIEASTERLRLLRFGARRVTYQHAELRTLLRIRLVRDRRDGWVIVDGSDEPAARSAIERLAGAMAVLPPGEPMPMPGPWSGEDAARAAATAPTDCAATLEVGPADQASAFSDLLGVVPEPLAVGGSISTRVLSTRVVNTHGLDVAERRTRAAIQVVVGSTGRSSFGRDIATCWDALDIGGLADRVLRDLAPDPGRVAPEPRLPGGAIAVVLGPQAVATLVATLAHIGLGAGPDGRATGPIRFGPGEPATALAPGVTIRDDATDPAGLPATFDSSGWPRRPVELVTDGRPVGLVQDARTAATVGAVPTGHTAPPGWRFGAGPAPSHVIVAAGRGSDEDLLAAVGEGIRIQRLDYVRVVQPRQGIVTGTTRDATRRIHAGRLGPGLPQVRFTAALVPLFAAVAEVGDRRESGEAPFVDAVVAPAMAVNDFPIDAEALR